MVVRRAGAWTWLALAGVLVTGACSGAEESSPTPSSSGSPKEQVDALLGTVLQEPAFRLEVTTEVDGEETLAVSGVQHTADGAETDFEAELDSGSEQLRVRAVDERIYVEAGPGAWLSLSKDDPDLGELGLAREDLSLEASLEEIAAGAESVREVEGEEDVDGVRTRRLDVEIDPTKLASLAPVIDPGDLTGPATCQLFVDDDGLLRRYVLVIDDAELDARQEVTLSDFGEADEVEAPAEHEPVTAQDLLGSST